MALEYSGYIWSTWTTKTAQPVHIDPALQAMIDQSLQTDSSAAGQTYHVSAPSSSSTMTGFKGSHVSSLFDAPPFPVSAEDASMETPADKRSRESPDSTLKSEGKSLKTSGVATATTEEPVVSSACAADAAATNEGNDDIPEAPTIRWKVNEIAETRLLMWQLHHRMPAWKLKACTEALQIKPVDLAALAEATGVQFASVELVEVAAKCLDEITKEMAKDDSISSGATAAAPCHDDKQNEKDESDPRNQRRSLRLWRTLQIRRILATSLLIHVPQHKGRCPKTQTLLSNNKMPQHHVMVRLPRKSVIL